eukprot:gene4095-6527_t
MAKLLLDGSQSLPPVQRILCTAALRAHLACECDDGLWFVGEEGVAEHMVERSSADQRNPLSKDAEHAAETACWERALLRACRGGVLRGDAATRVRRLSVEAAIKGA